MGLTKEQAMVYETLVKNGPSPARSVQRKTGISRPLVYKVLDQLAEFGLVEKKDEKGQVSLFIPGHPLKLKDFVRNQKERAEDAERASEGTLDRLISDFNLVSGKPGVRFFEGVEGIKEIYEDILAVGEDFYFIRPIYEPVFKEKMEGVIKDFVRERVKRGIKASALTPADVGLEGREPADDAKILLDRVWVDLSFYNSPVEINIYGQKISVISYSQELVGIIIESPQINRAFRQIFELSRLGAKATANGKSKDQALLAEPEE